MQYSSYLLLATFSFFKCIYLFCHVLWSTFWSNNIDCTSHKYFICMQTMCTIHRMSPCFVLFFFKHFSFHYQKTLLWWCKWEPYHSSINNCRLVCTVISSKQSWDVKNWSKKCYGHLLSGEFPCLNKNMIWGLGNSRKFYVGVMM